VSSSDTNVIPAQAGISWIVSNANTDSRLRGNDEQVCVIFRLCGNDGQLRVSIEFNFQMKDNDPESDGSGNPPAIPIDGDCSEQRGSDS
jgi:hypothetical protein